jgi:hypothetical protein
MGFEQRGHVCLDCARCPHRKKTPHQAGSYTGCCCCREFGSQLGGAAMVVFLLVSALLLLLVVVLLLLVRLLASMSVFRCRTRLRPVATFVVRKALSSKSHAIFRY